MNHVFGVCFYQCFSVWWKILDNGQWIVVAQNIILWWKHQAGRLTIIVCKFACILSKFYR